jgi:hypothetical protein
VRKKGDLHFSSFEMLLDAMCNTFGGIVFIALLLAILSNAIETENPVKYTEMPSSFEPLNSKLVDNLNTCEPKLAEISTLSLEIDQIKNKQQLLERKYSQLQSEIRHAENIKQALEKKVQAVRTLIDITKQQKQRKLRMPLLHQVHKHSVFFAVHNKKFYAISDIKHGYNGSRGFDGSDAAVQKETGLIQVEIKEDKGQPVTENAIKKGKLRQAIVNIDPEHEFVNFAVSKNSFGEFNTIKKIFIDKGFEYNWAIMDGNSFTISYAPIVHAQ